MNAQHTTHGPGGSALAMLADFSEVALLGLGAGLVFSLVAATLVIIVTTLA
ncbi:MAG: hypothetical protein WDN04_10815 [Rhodospirillales bacterium]